MLRLSLARAFRAASRRLVLCECVNKVFCFQLLHHPVYPKEYQVKQ
jgi:hypothetical protein